LTEDREHGRRFTTCRAWLCFESKDDRVEFERALSDRIEIMRAEEDRIFMGSMK